MSKIKEALGKKPTQSNRNVETFEGVFACQHRGCTEEVEAANYDRVEKLLVWKCPRGHTSYIEDFLG